MASRDNPPEPRKDDVKPVPEQDVKDLAEKELTAQKAEQVKGGISGANKTGDITLKRGVDY